jgi:uncharacterized iron-regulated membrane protein
MTKSFEKKAVWVWLHRWTGLVTFVWLGFAALTGCMLCFVRPLDAVLNEDLFKGPIVQRPIDVPAAVDLFQAAHPELRVRSFPLSVPAGARIAVKVEPVVRTHPLGYDQVFLDRATGREVGQRSTAASLTRRGATVLLHDIHYTLLAGKPGRYAFGVVALFWLLSNLVGFYLTFPRHRPMWGAWRRMWRFSLRSPTPRLMLDIHRSSGLWLLIPMTVLAFTSTALNFFEFYAPAAAAVVRPIPNLFDGKPRFPQGLNGKLGFARGVAILSAAAARGATGWRPATALYYPQRGVYGVALTDDGELNYRRLGPIYLYADGQNGQIVGTDNPYDGNTGLALVRMLYPLHSGRIAGSLGVAVVFLLGLATFEMCLTGLYIWWRKRRFRSRK